jgi:hypothetical protein
MVISYICTAGTKVRADGRRPSEQCTDTVDHEFAFVNRDSVLSTDAQNVTPARSGPRVDVIVVDRKIVYYPTAKTAFRRIRHCQVGLKASATEARTAAGPRTDSLAANACAL